MNSLQLKISVHAQNGYVMKTCLLGSLLLRIFCDDELSLKGTQRFTTFIMDFEAHNARIHQGFTKFSDYSSMVF